ncbi:hypothetical protein SAMN05421741_11812 [Paenimyroides ummariense]|uniref:Uncharacterized protein n=1 Tax=Paenimyroides ummariense TaxID=913024 RepID=A0A1I5DZ13_9FLAO|nr:hypothetical protein [Paenimyroides ummariense]SFO04436.1 hypothetical protein SAMN05421741_11812 [Paenimyroides ummariense]
MNKEEYLIKAFKEIRDKNLTVPFELVPGTTVTDIEKMLTSLGKSYLSTKSPIDKIFYEKIEELRKFRQ